MKKLDMILLFIVDMVVSIILIPMVCVVNTLYLIYICIRDGDNFMKEFTAFNKFMIRHIIGSFELHKGRILGD